MITNVSTSMSLLRYKSFIKINFLCRTNEFLKVDNCNQVKHEKSIVLLKMTKYL